MTYYSPLRYPGGKNKLSNFIASLCKNNNITDHYIEPYAGGAAIALHLLINGYVKKITINDMDRSIYAFWHSILNNNKKFCNRIERTKITPTNWNVEKKIQKNKNNESLFDLGFSTFFLNRTNYSGIIDAGMLGGINQQGNNKIDCRFNKNDLIKRIKKIYNFRKQINISNKDAIDLIKNKKINKNSLYYFDPPYYVNGSSLYMRYYEDKDHEQLAKSIKKMHGHCWIMTYDNVSKIKNLYKTYTIKNYSLYHTANITHKAKELIFFSKNLKHIPSLHKNL